LLANLKLLLEAFEKPGVLVKIKARKILKPQHINYIRGFQHFDNADIEQSAGWRMQRSLLLSLTNLHKAIYFLNINAL